MHDEPDTLTHLPTVAMKPGRVRLACKATRRLRHVRPVPMTASAVDCPRCLRVMARLGRALGRAIGAARS